MHTVCLSLCDFDASMDKALGIIATLLMSLGSGKSLFTAMKLAVTPALEISFPEPSFRDRSTVPVKARR
jgi:hypothetical protein